MANFCDHVNTVHCDLIKILFYMQHMVSLFNDVSVSSEELLTTYNGFLQNTFSKDYNYRLQPI